jgi:hypothetical protein
MAQASDEEFARAFAPLLEIMQGGKARAATPNDVLELLGAGGGPRYVLKGKDGRYLAEHGKGWTPLQREAIVMNEREHADQMCAMGLAQYGVHTRVVRLRRRGTVGIEGVRLRPGLDIQADSEKIEIALSNPEAMALLAALSGAKLETGEQ